MPTNKTIVIVGGVAGGMSCAARARRLDESATIIVLERGPYVSFANCGLPYYVGGEIEDRDALVLQTPQSLAASLNLDVRLHHDVIGVDPKAHTVTVATEGGEEQISYDALVLSPGAAPRRLPIDGLDSPRATYLRTVDEAIALREKVASGLKRAVVLGAGFIGVEAAEQLRHAGLEVTLVEIADRVLFPLEAELSQLAREELVSLGIDVATSTGIDSVSNGEQADTVRLSDGREIETDLLVVSAGVAPDTKVFEEAGVACERGAILIDEHGRTNLDDVWAVGDATAMVNPLTGKPQVVALAGPANRGGRLIADDILSPEDARPLPTPLGTAVVRIGSLTAAMTGARKETLVAENIPHTTIHTHPLNHVGYFPGASSLHLVTHIGADGEILGAAAIGKAGVARRIDVLATAMRAGMTAPDLIDLDLAYAPPYGAAKDPVNMIGMVAENLLTGRIDLWYAEDWETIKDDHLILDVRSEGEYASGHLPGSANIPHTELRGRLDEVRELAAGRPVRVLCGVGVRSHIANRVLLQAGFDTASLSGGWQTVVATFGAMGKKGELA